MVIKIAQALVLIKEVKIRAILTLAKVWVERVLIAEVQGQISDLSIVFSSRTLLPQREQRMLTYQEVKQRSISLIRVSLQVQTLRT